MAVDHSAELYDLPWVKRLLPFRFGVSLHFTLHIHSFSASSFGPFDLYDMTIGLDNLEIWLLQTGIPKISVSKGDGHQQLYV
jgi:hypothetical protein